MVELYVREINKIIDFVFQLFALEEYRPKVKIKKCSKRFWNFLYEMLEKSNKEEWDNTTGCLIYVNDLLQHLELEKNGYIILSDVYRDFLNSIKDFEYVMFLNKRELPYLTDYEETAIHETLHIVERQTCSDLIRGKEKRGEPVELDKILHDIFMRKYPNFPG